MKQYYVYILASKFNDVLYIGMTNDLGRRLYEHKSELNDGFTKKYKCHKLVYFEETSDVLSAIEREKQLKRWSRIKKNELILKKNKDYRDLSTALEMT